MSQVQGASPRSESRLSLRKPCTVPLVLKGTIHDKPVEEPMMVSTGQEQLESESRAVSPSQETVVVSTSTMPDMTTMPQGLVLSDIESATTPIITIRGDHALISPSELEGSLVREMASTRSMTATTSMTSTTATTSTTAGTPTQQDSPVPGEEGDTQGEQDPVEVIDVDSDEEDPEVNLNPRAALERSARERGIRNRRSYGRRRLYQAVVQLHRLSERSIRSWTRNRGRAIADPEVESPIGPTQVQRVRHPIRHPNEVDPPGLRHVPSSKKGSSPNK